MKWQHHLLLLALVGLSLYFNCCQSDADLKPDLSIRFANKEPCKITISSNEVIDTLQIHVEYQDYLLWQRHQEDITMFSFQDTTFAFMLIKPEIIRFTLNEMEIPIFIYPGLHNRINLYAQNRQLKKVTLDKHQSLSNYYSAIGKMVFSSADGDWHQIVDMV